MFFTFGVPQGTAGQKGKAGSSYSSRNTLPSTVKGHMDLFLSRKPVEFTVVPTFHFLIHKRWLKHPCLGFKRCSVFQPALFKNTIQIFVMLFDSVDHHCLCLCVYVDIYTNVCV